MRAVFAKEICQYRNSFAGAVFLAAYALMTGYFFTVGNLYQQNGSVGSLFESLLSMLMFLMPLLTMRLFAEEKKERTEQLLFTSPVSEKQVVWGKFLSAECMFLLGSLPVVLAVCILAAYGCFEPLKTAGNLLSLVLAGSAFIAVGMLVSALTQSQVVAAIVSYVLLLGLWLLGYALPYLPEGIVAEAVKYLSYRFHVQELAAGVFRFSTLVYFLSLTGLCLELNCLAIERH